MSTGPEKTSVQVAVRVRPITEEDLKNLPTKYQHSVISCSPFVPNQVVVQDGDKKYPYNFDYVFGQEATQKDVFEKSVLKLVEKFLEGYNVTILAYGQTSSGKTHTMGTTDNTNMSSESQGIVPRSMVTLFNRINSAQYKSRKFSMKASFIEIYNEDLIDLLGEGDDETRPQVLIREDNKGNILWSGLNELRVNNVEDVMSHLTRGSMHRQVGATEMNSKSSRSHAIFSITLSQQKFIPSSTSPTISSPPTPVPDDRPSTPGIRPPSSRSNSRLSKRFEDGEWVTITSKFHFVDLAGSERLKRTSAMGERAKEGISINSGLLALGNVISALGDHSKAKHTTHIPYRDSKLTRLLQDSLGGNSQTLMIACVSPAAYNLQETHNTIKYANRARNIKNTVTLNQEETGWNDIEHLQALVMKLRNEVKTLRNAVYGGSSSSSNGGGIIASNNNNDNNNSNCNNNSNASTVTSGIPTLNGSGRSTPISGRDTPSRHSSHLRRPSTPSSSTSSSLTSNVQKEKEIEALEEQLHHLQKSYIELTQKYAKTSAELAKHQDNADGILDSGKNVLETIEEDKLLKNVSASFQEAVEPVIEEYEKSVSSLESQLALTKAALMHSEKLMRENESKLLEAEQADQQNRAQILELRNKIGKLNENESNTETYIRDLEMKLEAHSEQQKLDQEMIQDLKSKITKLKDTGANNETYIEDLENRLSNSDNLVAKLTENIEKLEQRLFVREQEYRELEEKFYKSEHDVNNKALLVELDDRERRVSHLEGKVEELMNELENLRRLQSIRDGYSDENITHIHEKSTSSEISLISSNSDDNEQQERLNMLILEEKLLKLQKTHDNTCKEFEDLKIKYQSCLQEIQDLEKQVLEAKLIHDDKSTTPTTPVTPSSPGSSTNSSFNNGYRMSLPVNLRSSSSSITSTTSSISTIATSISSNSHINGNFYEFNNKEQPLINSPYNNPRRSPNNESHRKTRSLSTELKSNERRDLAHLSVVQKLQDDLNQLSLLHEDKTQGLNAIKSEFARLEIEYREKLEIVEELREEIKRRDILAQLEEVTAASTSDYHDYMSYNVNNNINNEHTHNNNNNHHHHHHHHQYHRRSKSLNDSCCYTNNNNSEYNSYYSGVSTTATTSEIDCFDIVQRLREEIEQLKEEQKTTMEIISQHEKAKSSSQSQQKQKIDDTESKLEENNQFSSTDDEEITKLKNQVEKLQMEIEAKGHTIDALLLPSNEHQITIRRLEDELQEVREAHRIATLKSNKLATISESAEYDNSRNEKGNDNITNNNNDTLSSSSEIAYSSDKLEQNIDENVKELEERVKYLEVQLTNAKEAQQVPTLKPFSLTSAFHSTDPTQKIINNLQVKLVNLQDELSSKFDNYGDENSNDKTENIKTGLELVSSIQQQLETLKDDVKHKHEIIESSKREIVDKGILQQKLRGKEAEANFLQYQLNNFKNSENEMKQQISQLQEKLKSFKSSSSSSSSSNNASLENEISDIKKELIKAKDNESFTIERLKVMSIEETKLHSELDRLKKIETSQHERIKVLESCLSQQPGKNIAISEDDFAKLKDELSLAKENENEQKKIIAQLEIKLKDSESEIRVLQVQLDELRKESDERMRTIKSNELKLKEQEVKEVDNDNEIKRLNKEVELLNEQEIEQSARIQSLESQLKLAQENPEIAELKSELANHKANKLLLENTVKDLETKLSEFQQDFEKLSSVQNELKLLKELDAEQKSSISQLQNQLILIQGEKESILKEIEAMKHDFETQKNLVITLEKDLGLAKAELTKAKEENQSISKKHEDLSTLLNQTIEERDGLDKKVKDLEVEIKVLNGRNSTKDEDISMVKSQLLETKNEMSQRNELLTELNSKLTAAEKEYKESIKLIEELEKEIEKKETEKNEAIETLESKISILQSQLEEAKNGSTLDQETIEKLNEKLVLLQSQLDQSKELDKQQSQTIKDLEGKIQEINEKVQEKDDTLNNNVEIIMELEGSLKNLQSQLESAKTSKSVEVEKLESKIAELEGQIKENPTREDLEALKESYDKQVELTKQLEMKLAAADIDNSESILQLTNRLISAKETEESLRKSAKEVEDKLRRKENEFDSLTNNLEKLKEKLKQVQSHESQHIKLIESLETQLVQTENQRDEEISKFADANMEIEQLKEKYTSLQNEIDEIQKESMEQNYQSIDSNLYEELEQQLKKSQEENQAHIEHTQQLENAIEQLESDKVQLEQTNAGLTQNIELLERELESLAEEYSEADSKYQEVESNLLKQKTRIEELEMEVEANKKQNQSTSNTTTLSQLASANEALCKTNDDLNKKLTDTENSVFKLSQQVKTLEQELSKYKSLSNDINMSQEYVQELKDKIETLEYEKDGLEEANKVLIRERKKLDDKVNSLLQQLQSSGRNGNKTASQLAELNNKIISLEKEISITKEKSRKDSEEMEKEMIKLMEINEKLESKAKENNDNDSNVEGTGMSMKHTKQENTIAEQKKLIKSLQDKILELEKQRSEETSTPFKLAAPAELDAVGGFRLIRTDSNSSAELMKNAIKNNIGVTSPGIMGPPTPPPNVPLPPVPPSPSLSSSSLISNPVSLPMTPPLSPPPRSPLPPRPDSITTSIPDLTSEVQKLNKKLNNLETENSQNIRLVETLEVSLNDTEAELNVAKQQLQVLQKEKGELQRQVKTLRDRLEEANAQFEHAQSSVQQEKKVIESVLIEERRAKQEAEKARNRLESQMEELMAKKNKFMCF